MNKLIINSWCNSTPYTEFGDYSKFPLINKRKWGNDNFNHLQSRVDDADWVVKSEQLFFSLAHTLQMFTDKRQTN